MCIYYYHVKYHIWCVCTWVEYKAIDNFIASFMKISLYSPNKKRGFGTTMKAGLRTLANTVIMSLRPGGVSPWCHSPPLSPMSRARVMTCCDPGVRPPAWSASASLESRDLEANKVQTSFVKVEANHSSKTHTWKLEYSASILENLVEMLSSVQSSLNIV